MTMPRPTILCRCVSTSVAAILLVAACAAPAPSSPASTPSPAAPTAAPATPSPSSTTSPTISASTTPAACGVQADEGRLPSDRLVDVEVSAAAGADVVTFVFGPPSSPAPPQGTSTGAIRAVEPPFTQAGSGEPIDVPGEHHVEVRFAGMTLYDETGAPTYDGPTTFREALPALRAMAQDDAFEGHSGWIIGYDGPGCVTLASGEGTVSVVIAHDAGDGAG